MRPSIRSWTIVGLGFFVLSLSLSARSTLQLAIPLWQAEFGWSRSLISAGGAAALVTSGAAAIFAGGLLARLGSRLVLSLGLLSMAAGLFATAAMGARPWQFLLLYGGVAATGFGIASVPVVATVVAWRFAGRRGLATGIATAGGSAGQLFLIPALAAVFQSAGWRIGYAALASASLVMLVLVAVMIRGPDQVAAGPAGDQRACSVRELWRSPVFHALLWSFVICGFTTSGVIETHFIPYAVLCGFPPVTGASAYGLLMGVNVGGIVLAGWLCDRMHRPLLLGSIYLLRGIAFLLLMDISGEPSVLTAFAVMFGLFDYATVPVTASLASSHLGLRSMGTVMGLLSAGHAIGGAVGAILAGAVFDAFARYDGVWLSSVVVAMLAGLISFTIRENRAARPRMPVAA